MKNPFTCFLLLTIALAGCSTGAPTTTEAPQFQPTESGTTLETPEISPPETVTPTPETPPIEAALKQISADSLFQTLKELTSVQPYSGWRNSASTGEAEAADILRDRFERFEFLESLGMEITEETFEVYSSTEIWEAELSLEKSGEVILVNANGIRANRYDPYQALQFDTDKVLNDSDRDPITVAGSPLVLQSLGAITALSPGEVAGMVVFLPYAILQPGQSESDAVARGLEALFGMNPGGLVLLAEKSNGNAKYLGGGSIFTDFVGVTIPPTLYVTMEDLGELGIDSLEELAGIESVQLTVDVDVYSPGTSRDLVVRIPGKDPSHALVIGAHLDSANTPGAIDNGMNAAALVELSRVLDAGEIQPPVDLYLVWFGSEEIWVYGSQHFVNAYDELLDRSLAVLCTDAIVVSLEEETLLLDEWPPTEAGSGETPEATRFAGQLANYGLIVDEIDPFMGIGSDTGVFAGSSNAIGFGFGLETGDFAHSPYDSFVAINNRQSLAEDVVGSLLVFALEAPSHFQTWDEKYQYSQSILIISKNTKIMHMSPATLIEFKRAFASQGIDVDVLPSGEDITAETLSGRDLVIVLPAIDFEVEAFQESGNSLRWLPSEIGAIREYVLNGGKLLITNSANHILFESVHEENEDWPLMNAIAGEFGITFRMDPVASKRAGVVGTHDLTQGFSNLVVIGNNNVGFQMELGVVLAEVYGGVPLLAIVEAGERGGEVIVLGDVGALGYAYYGVQRIANQTFFSNLAEYIKDGSNQ